MVLKYFTVQQMKEVTRRLVEPGEPRAILESFIQTKGLLGDVERVHFGLLEYTPAPTATKKVEELRNLEQLTDERYDDLLRGNWYTMTAQANYASSKEASTWFLTTRDSLLPDGLGGTQKSLREESGASQFLASKLTDNALQARLTKVPVGEGLSLFDTLRLQAETGLKLGPLEDQKDEALAEAAHAAQGPSDAAVRRSHLEWISVMRLLERTISLVRPSPEITEKVLGLLQKTAEVAQQRRDATVKAAAEKATAEKPPEKETKEVD
jgi:hypothetical protein